MDQDNYKKNNYIDQGNYKKNYMDQDNYKMNSGTTVPARRETQWKKGL